MKYMIYAPIGAGAKLHPIYAALVPLVAAFVLFGVQFLSFVPYASIGRFLSKIGVPNAHISIMYNLFVPFLLVALACFAWVKWVENRSLASMGWRFERAFFIYGRGFGIGLLLNVLSLVLIALWGGYEIGPWLPAWNNPSALLMIGLFLLGFVVQGGSEEILFRGWVLSAMAPRWGFPVAISVVSVLFALMHVGNQWPHINWIAMLNIGLVSVFFAIYAIAERTILGVCAVHSAWNWIMGVGFGLSVSSMQIGAEPLVVDLRQKFDVDAWITGGSFGPEGSLAVTVVLSVAIGVFVVLQRKKSLNAEAVAT